ncbi:MAG: hypothetical protein N2C12_17810 [Planctomycetales bacterium]
MAHEPLLTLEQLATVLKVPEQMVRDWQQLGILPRASEPDDPTMYSRAQVVQAIRNYPDIMEQIKSSMRRHDGDGS